MNIRLLTLFLDATKASGELLMWAQWENGTKFIQAKEANEKWPAVVIRFYEKFIHFV